MGRSCAGSTSGRRSRGSGARSRGARSTALPPRTCAAARAWPRWSRRRRRATSSNVLLKMEQDGRVVVLCAAPEIGAGQATVLCQMAADAVGVPLDAVSLPAADRPPPRSTGRSRRSRTTFHVGSAIRTAGAEIRRKALALAGNVLEIDPADLDLRDGVIVARGVGPRVTLGELLGRYGFEGYSLVAEARYSSAGSALLAADPGLEPVSTIFWMISTQAAEIEVDIETGVIRVVRSPPPRRHRPGDQPDRLRAADRGWRRDGNLEHPCSRTSSSTAGGSRTGRSPTTSWPRSRTCRRSSRSSSSPTIPRPPSGRRGSASRRRPQRPRRSRTRSSTPSVSGSRTLPITPAKVLEAIEAKRAEDAAE